MALEIRSCAVNRPRTRGSDGPRAVSFHGPCLGLASRTSFRACCPDLRLAHSPFGTAPPAPDGRAAPRVHCCGCPQRREPPTVAGPRQRFPAPAPSGSAGSGDRRRTSSHSKLARRSGRYPRHEAPCHRPGGKLSGHCPSGYRSRVGRAKARAASMVGAATSRRPLRRVSRSAMRKFSLVGTSRGTAQGA